MFLKRNKNIGCFVIPEIPSQSSDMAPLIHYLQTQGYFVGCPDSLTCVKPDPIAVYPFWINSIEKSFSSFAKSCDVVIVVGFSLGGLAGVHLASKYEVDALITINTPAHLQEIWNLYEKYTDVQSQRGKNILENCIRNLSRLSLPFSNGYRDLVRAVKEKIPVLRCPILVIQGKKDTQIKWSNAYYIYEKAASREKEIQFFPKSGHHICQDCEYKLVFIKVVQFIERVAENRLLLQRRV